MASNEFERYRIEVETAKDQARVYQLSLWPDNARAIPESFVACALFAAIQGKHSTAQKRARLASINGITVIYTGQRLTQVHADVWQGIMHLARQQGEGAIVRFSASQLLRLIGRHTGKTQHEQLKVLIAQLCGAVVEIQHDDVQRRFFGSLLPRGAADDAEGMYCVEISRELARVLSDGIGLVDWGVRMKLRNKPLALWLQLYFSRFTKPAPVAQLHALSGSGASLKEFRRHLAAALNELHSARGHAAAIDRERDVVVACPEARPPRAPRPRRSIGQQRVLPFERPAK